jgi:serine phosphatase RsbU (regulator of sigma subunit)
MKACLSFLFLILALLLYPQKNANSDSQNSHLKSSSLQDTARTRTNSILATQIATHLQSGNALLLKKQTAKAKEHFDLALGLGKKLNAPELIYEAYHGLGLSYEQLKDFKKAHAFMMLFAELKDSVLNEKNATAIAEMQTRYKTEKKESEIAALKKNKALEEITMREEAEDMKRQKLLLSISSGGVGLILLLSFFIQKGYREKKAANLLLEQKQKEMLRQNAVLEEKNSIVTDSIQYAKEIQEIIKPSESELRTYFPESFVICQPKDIVAGDFYWLSSKRNKVGTDTIELAVCDCTGHGVPGAFMALHGYSLLDRIARNNLKKPAEILNELNAEVRSTMRQGGTQASAKYGIDMGLVQIAGREISFAGAHNSLLICNENMQEIKADRTYIGGATNDFTQHRLTVPQNSMVYLFTDGYADQKGEQAGHKFFISAFKELLFLVSTLPAAEQKKMLEETFDKWKGKHEQIDDVLVIGIRII